MGESAVEAGGGDALEKAKSAALSALVESVEGGGEVDGLKTRKGKKKKKKRRARKADRGGARGEDDGESETPAAEDDVEVEYVAPDDIVLDEGNTEVELDEFREVFERFKGLGGTGGSYAEDADVVVEGNQRTGENGTAGDGDKDGADDEGGEDGDGDGDDEDGADKKLSRRQRKMQDRMSVAKLKQGVSNPEVVEQWDVTAADPKLLVHLKSYRNSVAVPVHWRQKRKYLQNKRGMHKAPFQLPAFIEQTGIQKMRDAYAEAEESKSLKQKQREKIRPKLGKADIDYQVLHDAFFKFQTKPSLSEQGDLYYELRELEVNKKNFKPGVLSENLRAALGMNDPLDPPPWLYNMQRYPPPPSYPYLKIPGYNAPIPTGATYGYFPGWGRPPVDAMNRPLYGDVFGMGHNVDEREAEIALPEEQKAARWGEQAEESDDEEESEEEAEEAEQEAGDVNATENDDAVAAGIESSTSLLPGGVETPAAAIELRKGVQPPKPDKLYTVVEEKKASVGSGLLGTSHVYELGGKKKKVTGDGVEVNLNPEDLEEGLDEAMIRKKYEQKKAEETERKKGEDVSDIVVEGIARKRKEIEKDKEKRAKRAKDAKDLKF